jgi:hypothetical protein
VWNNNLKVNDVIRYNRNMSSIFSKPNIKKYQSKKYADGSTTELNIQVPPSVSHTHNSTKMINRLNIIDSVSDNNVEDDNEEMDDNYTDTDQMILYIDDIKNSIPPDAVDTPNAKLQKTHTEIRWRFFNLKGRKLIEISKKKHNGERIYVDNTGKWINYELKGNWNQFLIGSKYYYCL